MPEIARFFGIVIRMFVEPGESHHRAHFHAYYQEASAVFAINPLEVIGGELPSKQRRLVEAWGEIHQAELEQDWQRLQTGLAPFKIEPLH